ncbi:MAG: hypothetical protein ACI8XW_003467, partial [Gammaproteobacteria bacterium]
YGAKKSRKSVLSQGSLLLPVKVCVPMGTYESVCPYGNLCLLNCPAVLDQYNDYSMSIRVSPPSIGLLKLMTMPSAAQMLRAGA